MLREFGIAAPQSKLEIVVDASPWGIGGYLAHMWSGTVLAWFADPLTNIDEKHFQHRIGEASGQQCWEALALLVALTLWGGVFANHKMMLRVRSD
eukprot:3884615-Karenia_brevis.AAC.1